MKDVQYWATVESFTFHNCFNVTFSQIEIIIKFFKNFVKDDLNFSQMALCERFTTTNVKYCGFFLAQHKHWQKIKTRIICEIFEIKYIDTSFQVANRTEINFPAKKNYLSENLWLNSGEKQKILSY